MTYNKCFRIVCGSVGILSVGILRLVSLHQTFPPVAEFLLYIRIVWVTTVYHKFSYNNSVGCTISDTLIFNLSQTKYITQAQAMLLVAHVFCPLCKPLPCTCVCF